jgi:hypothetical protein
MLTCTMGPFAWQQNAPAAALCAAICTTQWRRQTSHMAPRRYAAHRTGLAARPGTNWDTIPAVRIRRNLRRHLRQPQDYLHTAIEEMDAGQWPGGIVGALLYPARPASDQTREMIETLAGEQAIMVT